MEQGYIKLGQIRTFVLDEANRMLDMGFLPDIKHSWHASRTTSVHAILSYNAS